MLKRLVLTVLDIPLRKFKLSSTLFSLFVRGRACLSSKNDAMSNWVNCWANFQPYKWKTQLLADDFVSTAQDIALGFTWHRVTAIALNYFNSPPSLHFARDSWAIMRVRNLFCCHFGRKYYLHSIMALIVWSQLILCPRSQFCHKLNLAQLNFRKLLLYFSIMYELLVNEELQCFAVCALMSY